MYAYNAPTAFFMEVQTFDARSLGLPRARSRITRFLIAAVGVVWEHLSALILLAGIALFVFLLLVFLFSLPAQNVASSSATAPPQTAFADVPPLEVHIAENGLVLLRSAQVVAVTGNTITLSTAWGSTNLKWIVHTDASSYGARHFGTSFFTRGGKELSLQDVRVGDFVTVDGTLDNTAQAPTLKADVVRSLQK